MAKKFKKIVAKFKKGCKFLKKKKRRQLNSDKMIFRKGQKNRRKKVRQKMKKPRAKLFLKGWENYEKEKNRRKRGKISEKKHRRQLDSEKIILEKGQKISENVIEKGQKIVAESKAKIQK